MGWLREMMRQAPDSPRSLSEVARRALAHPDWQDEVKPQERSLAALFSKLDRGIELEWLADRPAVQQVLAQVLGAPRSRIAEAVGATTESSTPRRLRLDDVPYAAPVDLTEERLPPAIPESISRPSEWPLWWVAPPGSGRSLAGAWLATRGLSTHVTARTWHDALASMPPRGPVFVELLTHEGPAPKPPRDEVCVAAPGGRDTAAFSGWHVVESEEPSQWLEPLVRWLARRLPRDGHFATDGALDWLRGEIKRGFIDGLGTALGLAGLVDRYGAEELKRAGLSRTAARFIRESVAKTAPKSGADTSFVEDNAVEILRLLARGLFTDSSDPWGAPRSLDEWVRLVPAEYQQGVDAEYVRLSVARRNRAPTVEELERAMREMPPGGFRVVQTLERAGLLRRAGTDTLSLGPRWLARWLEEDALSTIVEAKPENWGEALLLTAGAPAVARGIVEHALVGDASIFEDVLGGESEDEGSSAANPATVAALEMAFRAAGLSVLVRGDIADDVLLTLWDRQLTSLVEREDGPHPRIEYAASMTASEPLLDVGVFWLAALALSECLPARRGAEHPVLRPWTEALSADAYRPILDVVLRALSRFDAQTVHWAIEGYALGARLHEVLAREDPDVPVHALAWPGTMAKAAEQGRLDWAAFRAGADARGLAALFSLASAARVSEASLARSVWLAFVANKERIDEHSPLWPEASHGAIFWRHAPTAALATVTAHALIDPRALRSRASTTTSGAPSSTPIRAPSPASAPICRPCRPRWWPTRSSELPSTPTISRPCGLAPRVHSSTRFAAAAVRGSPRLAALLTSAPDDRTEVVSARLSAELHRAPQEDGDGDDAASAGGMSFGSLTTIREYLHDRVRARSPGFRVAFQLLNDLG